MKILVIDDEIQIAELLADAVRQQGHDVNVAHDGEEALVVVDQTRPDAVFLDVRLGELTGIEVLRRIRRDNPGLHVVLITGHARPDEVDEARRLGVIDILEKPFILKQLTEALGALHR